jgi:hypothetical protein
MGMTGQGMGNDMRRHGRHRILLAATICSVHGEIEAVLLDLSRGGAMMNASPPPPVGCKLLIERHNLEISGAVRWVDGNRFGVCFDAPLSEDAVTLLVSRSGQTSPVALSHPAFLVRPSSA